MPTATYADDGGYQFKQKTYAEAAAGNAQLLEQTLPRQCAAGLGRLSADDRRRSRVDLTLDKEAGMAIARVVTFDGVNSDRMAEMQREMEGSERPDDVPAKEIVVLHDPDGEKSLVILFFDTEDDYRQGDEALNAMPADDTPGKRTSVTRYDVAFRMTD